MCTSSPLFIFLTRFPLFVLHILSHLFKLLSLNLFSSFHPSTFSFRPSNTFSSCATVSRHCLARASGFEIGAICRTRVFILIFPCPCNRSLFHTAVLRAQGFTRQIHATGLHDLNVTAVSFSRRQHTHTHCPHTGLYYFHLLLKSE